MPLWYLFYGKMCLYRGGGASMAGSNQGFTRWLFMDQSWLGGFRSAQCSGSVFVPGEGGGGGLASDTHIVVHRVMSSPNMWLKWLGQSENKNNEILWSGCTSVTMIMTRRGISDPNFSGSMLVEHFEKIPYSRVLLTPGRKMPNVQDRSRLVKIGSIV